ncbi:DUF2200 family protein [Kocuria marina]|uniref:DUF2200 family protein n=1 Tax=Kocuria marina TaxID=223184 RepID=UPI002989F614|nr:DUF2200 family protein [Kocuria marina]
MSFRDTRASPPIAPGRRAPCPQHRSYTTSVASVYPHYVTKVGKKSRTKDEVDQIICWLTGYSPEQLRSQLDNDVDFQTSFTDAPAMEKILRG